MEIAIAVLLVILIVLLLSGKPLKIEIHRNYPTPPVLTPPVLPEPDPKEKELHPADLVAAINKAFHNVSTPGGDS